MKKVITASRDKKLHQKKLAEAYHHIDDAIDCLEVARREAHNGDSSGKLLQVIRQAESTRKYLSRYRSGNPVSVWE